MFQRKNNFSGFTLVEVVLAMAIMTIIFIVFLTLFTSGFVWVFAAGDKGHAYSQAQQDIEQRLATQDSHLFDDLKIVFDGVEIDIPGGLIESNQTVGRSSSAPEVFIPWVPYITIGQNFVEGTSMPVNIEVKGYNTHFHSDNTKFELLTENGRVRIGDLFSGFGFARIPDPLGDDDIDVATFSLSIPASNALVNAHGEYYNIRAITTNIPHRPDEFARAKIVVEQPKLIAVGGSGVNPSIYVSADGVYWLERASLEGFPFSNQLNGITFGLSRYVAVGNGGRILTSPNHKPWTSTVAAGGLTLNDIIFSANQGKFFVVGNTGIILSSSDGISWSQTLFPSSVVADLEGLSENDGFTFSEANLMGIDFFDETELPITTTIAVAGSVQFTKPATIPGEEPEHNTFGVVMTSPDGVTWSLVGYEENAIFKDVSFGSTKNVLFAVGERLELTDKEGLYIHLTGGIKSVWNVPHQLNSVSSLQNGEMVAVGNNGTIINEGIMSSSGSNNLNGIYLHDGKLYAVGDQQTLIRKISESWDSVIWSAVNHRDLFAVAGR